MNDYKDSEMKRKTVTKSPFACIDGPLQGKTLFLQPDGCTAIFTINGQCGRYRQGLWERHENAA